MKKIFTLLLSCFFIVNLSSQEFEVTASLYPWDVHDEGIENILDNLIELAGVNSVYLISVMHQEHRPFFGPKERGPWLFPHNPLRKEWYAEDSRAFFHPEYDLYENVVPLLSSFPWLSETDWLDVVVKAARKRGMKVGAEVSHTYLPRDILVNFPEWQQKTLREPPYEQNNHPYAKGHAYYSMLPCINNPGVQSYLKSLYYDLAKNYDIDFVQTCMYTFSGNDVYNGTCFCENCQIEAKKMGFDLKSAISVLKDNPNALPEREQWLDFRIKSTNKIYKMIIDEMRKAKPEIDFRINDLNNRVTGLHLEDLEDYITSIHMSTHTEQNGIERTDRESRIATMKYLLPSAKVIPGIPVRILTTENIVKSSIKRSVDAGINGIALKHYDGAPFSNLRAVKEGLFLAGVKGYEPVQGYKFIDMKYNGFARDSFLLENCLVTTSRGEANIDFNFEPGNYSLVINVTDEDGGQGKINVYINGDLKQDFKLNNNNNAWSRIVSNPIDIKSNDKIRIEAVSGNQEKVRLEFIEFHKKN